MAQAAPKTHFEEYMATGRRKTSVARVRLVPGNGRIVINGRDIADYFGQSVLHKTVGEPFDITDTVGRFDTSVNVYGGGFTGQAEAIRHGIARALLLVDDEFRRPLKQAGLLTRDSRMKERHKYGLKKARKAPQFSKR